MKTLPTEITQNKITTIIYTFYTSNTYQFTKYFPIKIYHFSTAHSLIFTPHSKIFSHKFRDFSRESSPLHHDLISNAKTSPERRQTTTNDDRFAKLSYPLDHSNL